MLAVDDVESMNKDSIRRREYNDLEGAKLLEAYL